MRVIMNEKGNKYLLWMLKEVKSIKDIPLFVQLALSLFSPERSDCTALWQMHASNTVYVITGGLLGTPLG